MKRLYIFLIPSLLLAMLVFTLGCELNTDKDTPKVENSDEQESRGLIDSYKKDKYEGDSARSRAKWISTRNQYQTHNFYDDSHDFVKFNAEAHTTYLIETECRGNADTILSVYDDPTADKILRNNNTCKKVDLSSRIIYRNQQAQTIWVEIESNNGKGPNKEYRVRVSRVEVIQSDKLNRGRDWRIEYNHQLAYAKLRDSSNGQYHYVTMYQGGTSRSDVKLRNGNYRLLGGDYEFIFDMRRDNNFGSDYSPDFYITENRNNGAVFAGMTIEVPNYYERFKIRGRVNSTSYYGELCITLGGGEYGNRIRLANTLLVRHY